MKLLYAITSFILSSLSIIAYAQNSTELLSLEIDRLVVKNGNGFSYKWEWQDYEASQWGLVKRSKKLPYKVGNKINYLSQDYWGWENETIRNEILSDGSRQSTSVNSYIQTSINLHPEVIYICFKNSTSYYVCVDLSSLHLTIGYPESDTSDRQYDFHKSNMPLRNLAGTAYHFVVIPPYASVKSGFYRLDFELYGSKIIHSEILNNSRLDLTVDMSIFRGNPITRNQACLDNYKYKCRGYEEYSPASKYILYKGGYFKDTGGAYYIIDDLTYLFDAADLKIEEQVICKVIRTGKILSTSKNDYGLFLYNSSTMPRVLSTTVSKDDNSLVRPEDEPRGNLGKTLSQVRQIYPGISYVGTNRNMTEYGYGSRTFTFKNNILVCEGYYTYYNGAAMYSYMKTELNETPYESKSSETNNGMCRMITFYYSVSSIVLGFWNDGQYMISYISDDYYK